MHRYYVAGTGRFLTSDPLGCWFDAGNAGNGYGWAGNRYRNAWDPVGLGPRLPKELKDAVVAAATQGTENLKVTETPLLLALMKLWRLAGAAVKCDKVMTGAMFGSIIGVLGALTAGPFGPLVFFGSVLVTEAWIGKDLKDDIDEAQSEVNDALTLYDQQVKEEVQKIDDLVDQYNEEHGTHFTTSVVIHDPARGDRLAYVGENDSNKPSVGARKPPAR